MRIKANTVGDIGAAIRARRRELGWDQAMLASKIGVSRLWINQVEGGKPGASLGLVLRALAALDLTPTLSTPEAAECASSEVAPIESPDIIAILAAARGKPSL